MLIHPFIIFLCFFLRLSTTWSGIWREGRKTWGRKKGRGKGDREETEMQLWHKTNVYWGQKSKVKCVCLFAGTQACVCVCVLRVTWTLGHIKQNHSVQCLITRKKIPECPLHQPRPCVVLCVCVCECGWVPRQRWEWRAPALGDTKTVDWQATWMCLCNHFCTKSS